MKTDSRVLIFGGCHVLSYPPDGIVDILGQTFTGLKPIAHTKASHTRKIQSEIITNAPSVVVFQLGNFENPFPILNQSKKKIYKLFRIPTVNTTIHQHPYPRWIPTRTKIALDKFLSHLHLSIANPHRYNCNILRTLLAAKEIMGKKIIVLSPFPSTDPWMQYGRQKAHLSMKKICLDLQLQYINLFECLGNPLERYFLDEDAFHLNSEGCALLVRAVEFKLFKAINLPQDNDHATTENQSHSPLS